MRVTLLGLPQAGQQLIFSLLTGVSREGILQKPLEAHIGVGAVRDPRVSALQNIFHPKKTTFARIEFLLLPDFDLRGSQKELLVGEMKNADEFCFVVRAVGAAAEITAFLSELILYDLMLVEKRTENIEKERRRKATPQQDKEIELLKKIKDILEQEKLLSSREFAADQLKALRAYQFLTFKPIVIALNLAENELADREISRAVKEKFSLPAVQLCAEIESEISRLEAGEQAAFMRELGVDEPALAKISRLTFEGLGLISFFTVGEDEVRAWQVRRGSNAQEAGGAIHSDIEKGFVRAELMRYEDFVAAGSEARLKEQGKFYLKGRDYIVEDGDILSFRFSG
jgi:GTP-binding protein YchF